MNKLLRTAHHIQHRHNHALIVGRLRVDYGGTTGVHFIDPGRDPNLEEWGCRIFKFNVPSTKRNKKKSKFHSEHCSSGVSSEGTLETSRHIFFSHMNLSSSINISAFMQPASHLHREQQRLLVNKNRAVTGDTVWKKNNCNFCSISSWKQTLFKLWLSHGTMWTTEEEWPIHEHNAASESRTLMSLCNTKRCRIIIFCLSTLWIASCSSLTCSSFFSVSNLNFF